MMNTLSSRVLAGLFAVAFVIYIGRGSKSVGRNTPSCLVIGGLLSIALAMGIAPQQAMAATPLANDATVRVTSQSIEAGWHKERMHLDANKCWMVKLDKATQDGYTMIALIGVAELQVAQNEKWASADVKAVVKAQPPVCMEYDAD